MSTDDLRSILAQLRDELHTLDAAEPRSQEDRELLEQAAAEIRDALEADEKPGHEIHVSLLERLEDLAERLEDEHPRLTFAIGRLSDMLGKLGI